MIQMTKKDKIFKMKKYDKKIKFVFDLPCF